MCTAITYKTPNLYFGRNLDLEYSYHETVTITPRSFPFEFNDGSHTDSHYAIIGVAYVVDNYPLYYDAGNEFGLCMAGLSFQGNAVYNKRIEGRKNISPYEFIPWVLCQCKNIDEVLDLLENLNLVDIHYNNELPLTDLHWIIADSTQTIVVEAVASGLKIYDNDIGVLTNNPPFKYHLNNLNNYMSLSNRNPENTFSFKVDLNRYSHGMGALGLPGDLSSMSRFVKAAFVKCNSESDGTTEDDVSQFFHILTAVEQQRGCVKVGDKNEITVYSSCFDASNGVYYYKTYSNNRINAVKMDEANMCGDALTSFQMSEDAFIYFHN